MSTRASARAWRVWAGGKAGFAWSGEQALVDAGLAGLNLDQLDRLTTGRQVGMTFTAADDHFSLSGTTRRDDLGDQLRFLATKLAHPSWDGRAVERVKNVLLASYDSQDNSAIAVVNRDLSGFLHGGDRRWASPSRADIQALTVDRLKAYWTPVLQQGSIEVAIFGDYDRDTAIRQAAATFGALPPRPEISVPAAARAQPVFAAATRPLVASHTGPADQAAAVLAWPTGGGLERLDDSYGLEVLAAVFGDRLLDRLRSEEGESYSPQVISQWPRDATAGGSVFVLGQVRPGSADRFFALSESIAADLRDRPLSADEFERARGPILQNYARASSGNTFWLRMLQGVSRNPAVAAVPSRLGQTLGALTPVRIQALGQALSGTGHQRALGRHARGERDRALTASVGSAASAAREGRSSARAISTPASQIGPTNTGVPVVRMAVMAAVSFGDRLWGAVERMNTPATRSPSRSTAWA